MGYSTTFRLKGEIDKQFQIPEYREKNEIEIDKSKSILNAICLFNYDIPQNRYNMYISMSNVYDNIKVALEEMVRDAEDLAKKKLSLNENNEIDFYGWQYSDDDNHMGFDSIDEFKKTILDQLFQLVVCPTHSRFDKERNDFNMKEEQVFDILNDIEYEVSEIVAYNFVKYYRDHPELADEDDGINHFFPKEEFEKKQMEQKNNIIFLDIDGVLNYTKWYQGFVHYKYLDEEDIDPICIERVKIICEICDAKIVISSDWRLDWDITLKLLSKFGLDNNFIIDKTPFLNYLEVKNITRGKEIDEWLKNNKCDNYLILDDMGDVSKNFTKGQIKHLIRIDPFYGLTNKHVKQSLKIFNIL